MLLRIQLSENQIYIQNFVLKCLFPINHRNSYYKYNLDISRP